MNFFYVLNGKKTKQFMLIIMISFFTALLLFTQNLLNIPVFSGENGAKAIYKGEKDIALTFNIGWGDEKAEPIIDQLIEEKIKATFFLSGSWAERHPELVKKIADNGFEIGILGYSFQDYTTLEDGEVKKDIQKALEVFKKLQIKEISLLRVPTGHFDARTIKIADQYGLTVVHWSLNSQDWKNPGVDQIINNVKNAQSGDIVLMHASDSAKQTKSALPEIINILRNKGELVTTSDMIANGKVRTTLIP